MAKLPCLHLFDIVSLLLLLLPLASSLLASHSPRPQPVPHCQDEERSALWEFYASSRSKHPNSWCSSNKVWEQDQNCCSWDGVECGGPHGHVIGLTLGYCFANGPYGSIDSNSSIFRLVHLQRLKLENIYFSGSQIPASIGKLWSLTELILSTCDFGGAIPRSLSNLTKLVTLDLSFNKLNGTILHLLSNMTRLQDLNLVRNEFTGAIPQSLTSLTQLTHLHLYSNNFTGEIPYGIGRLTHLQTLKLSFNRLHGQVPKSLFQLRNLSTLSLGSNNLGGTLHLDMFSGMESLDFLDLSFNNFSVAFGSTESHSLRNIDSLFLAQCNLNEFPRFLEKLDRLIYLDLSNNNLSGEVPKWFLSARVPTLEYLNLSINSLTGYRSNIFDYNSTRTKTLDLRFNKLQGSLPIPSHFIMYYLVSNNMLSGGIPPQICNSSPIILDLSKNNFTGELPQCLSELGKSLSYLSLHSNSFHGRIPPLGGDSSGCSLEMIDLSNNQLQGPLPRSLSHCSDLTLLNVGNNRVNDTFPSFLGSLPRLRVLILRSNYFHGGIGKPENETVFPGLQIIDLSYNSFYGPLPSLYFQYWTYMGKFSPEKGFYLSTYDYYFSMTMVNKGVESEYEKILALFEVVDLSSNNFTGEISDSIAILDGLKLVNLSNNLLTGSIPPSLSALKQLESLDLSWNDLSGGIPWQLTQLNFLSTFNVSYNNLSGDIPHGNQFGAFPNSSYFGNTGLCGDPLSKKCGSFPPSEESDGEDEDSDVPFEIEWKAVALGYISTFIIGAVIGHKVITKHLNWFARTFRLRQL